MSTFLFDEIVFGPLTSRRLGVSLGINLISPELKICNYDCVYCECGWTNFDKAPNKFVDLDTLETKLRQRMAELIVEGVQVDHITFAGNGEPTLHPAFERGVDIALECRNQYFPNAKVVVLSNATTLHRKQVVRGLQKADLRIMKLDAGLESTYQRINMPPKGVTLDKITEQLAAWPGDLIIQSMFLRGTIDGEQIDNTTSEEISAWLKRLQKIRPKKIMLYSIDRDTPVKTLKCVPKTDLTAIAEQAAQLGFKTMVTG